jgi:hypothetical protein
VVLSYAYESALSYNFTFSDEIVWMIYGSFYNKFTFTKVWRSNILRFIRLFTHLPEYLNALWLVKCTPATQIYVHLMYFGQKTCKIVWLKLV